MNTVGQPSPFHTGKLEMQRRVGALGIDYATRRRNRVNGLVISVDRSGFVMRVTQSFGNCPKYIQLRDTQFSEPPGWRAQPVASLQSERVVPKSAPMRAAQCGASHVA